MDNKRITGLEPEHELNALADDYGRFCRKVAETMCVLARVHERNPTPFGNIVWQAVMLTAAGDAATRRWATRYFIGLVGYSLPDYEELAASVPPEELEQTADMVGRNCSSLRPRDAGRGGA